MYINMLEYQDAIGVDWSTDTYDAGLHLNVWGAEKAASWLGGILQGECGVPDHREDQDIAVLWVKKTKIYNEEKGSE